MRFKSVQELLRHIETLGPPSQGEIDEGDQTYPIEETQIHSECPNCLSPSARAAGMRGTGVELVIEGDCQPYEVTMSCWRCGCRWAERWGEP